MNKEKSVSKSTSACFLTPFLSKAVDVASLARQRAFRDGIVGTDA